MLATKEEIIAKLRRDIISWEGFRPPQPDRTGGIGLGPLEKAFPNGVFPAATIHEFISECPEDTAVTGAFIGGLLSRLLESGGICLWISFSRRIYPPSMKFFGIDPDRIVFVDVPRVRDVLWVTEEVLKCDGVAAVVSETSTLSFMESRRLQLAVEKSQVTGFVLRKNVRQISNTACAVRWKVTARPSVLRPGMPGVGYPRWHVELLKVKNGTPGQWTFEWRGLDFVPVSEEQVIKTERKYA